MQSRFLPQWQAYIRYHDLPGAEPARVYLHGLGSASSADFPTIVAHPALRQHRSLLIDFLGFGFSDRPEGYGYSLEDHCQTVAELLDYLGLQGCAVIGHSMGGSVAITLAALRPNLVSRLVVAEGNLDPAAGTISTLIAGQTETEFKNQGLAVLMDLVAAQAREGSLSSAAYLSTLRAAAPHAIYRSAVSLVEGTRPTMRERFVALPIPRAFVFGQESMPDEDVEYLPQYGIKIFTVPDAGHGMAHDNPRGFAEAIAVALDI